MSHARMQLVSAKLNAIRDVEIKESSIREGEVDEAVRANW